MAKAKTKVSKAAEDKRKRADVGDRDKILESIKANKCLYAAYEWIKDWKAEESSRDLRSRYRLGEFCQQIIQDEQENNGSLYGLNAFGRLSSVFDEDKSFLQAAVRFANSFTPEQLDYLCNARRADGTPISWSHVRWLLTITQPTVREDMLARLLVECWTSDQFGKECGKVVNGADAKPRPGGRKVSAPKNLKGLLNQVGAYTEKINKRAINWTDAESSPAAMVLDMPPAQIDDNLVRDLISKRNACEESIQHLSQTKRELDKAIARAQRTLAKNQELGAARATGAIPDGVEDDDDDEDDGSDDVSNGTSRALVASA
jgi:hypothetical protein